MKMNYNMKKSGKKKFGEKLKLIQNKWKVVKTWTKVLRESKKEYLVKEKNSLRGMERNSNVKRSDKKDLEKKFDKKKLTQER
jgi:hypothetical protein